MKLRLLSLLGLACLVATFSRGAEISTADLRIRDPFILPDPKTHTYFLYRQIANGRLDGTSGTRGVEVYSSTDLKTWHGPETVFAEPPGFWANAEVWAPEVHVYHGRYYLFVTLSANHALPAGNPATGHALRQRGTQILVADQPTGPFVPFANHAHTPADWMALDGTFWVEDGVPWMIFCHEWVQIHDGSMEEVRLAPDLSHVVGEPRTLFHASDAPWAKSINDGVHGKGGFVTDGPFLYRTRTGQLLMIWSTFGAQRYAVVIAKSESGHVTGPWRQQPEPLFKANGGHGMIFRTFEGQLLLCLHQPNDRPNERLHLFPLEDTGETLRLAPP